MTIDTLPSQSNSTTDSSTHSIPLRFKNPQEVKQALSELSPTSSSLKESLLRCYLLNLIFYQQVEPSHPAKDTLIKLSVYLDLLDKAKPKQPAQSQILQQLSKTNNTDKNLDTEIDNELDSDSDNQPNSIQNEDPTSTRRPINYVIEKNRLHTEKRSKKKEERNPRIKNKRRYQDAKDLAKKVRNQQ
ncbi:hypothetical protein NEHOM01_2076 [Nematocida homosporus]|uniref:uncharacterized protein n=1 Tax=Nematocida homosporus TaxID=1912981 RepID=UPI00221F576E|nr:uncharacterized protein NEHOM01_2076 [Nematocida homosporus]KAI5187298.1 hypothetical protein NEHOM01_2076 [Nematocida homosporus]